MSNEIVPVLDGSEAQLTETGNTDSYFISSVDEFKDPGTKLSKMRSEIAPVLDGSEQPSADRGPQLGLGITQYIPSFHDLFKCRPEFGGSLIGYNHEMRHFLSPEKGQRYVTQSNPTPISVKLLLETMKEPFLLQLRGCEKLFLRNNGFSFEKFKTLTSLEISGVSHLTTLPEIAFSEMTQLHTLILSHLPMIQQLPHKLFSNLTHLHSLVLKCCSNLDSLPDLHSLKELKFLDISYLLIETVPLEFFPKSQELRWVIFRGCSKLRNLPVFPSLKIEVLDISQCTTLEDLGGLRFRHPGLRMLDLSNNAFTRMPSLFGADNLTHLLLRDTKLTNKHRLTFTSKLEVLDLSGAQYARQIKWDFASQNLLALDLSRTDIESIDSLSNMIHLQNLILRDCTELVKLPKMKSLTNLEVLDISGCEILNDLPEDLTNLRNLKELNLSRCSGLKELREGLFDQMSCLEKLDLSKIKFKKLPSFANLTCLQILNLSHTSLEKLQGMSKLVNLKELLLENCQDFKVLPDVQALTNLERFDHSLLDDDATLNGSQEACTVGWDDDIHPRKISKYDEIHLVSTFLSTSSGFDRFSCNFGVIEDQISNIHRKFKSGSNKGNIQTQVYKRHFGGIRADLKYILKNISLLESSLNRKSSEKLLEKLLDVVNHLSAVDSSHDYTQLNELLRIVAKLKLLVPPGRVDDKEEVKIELGPQSYSDEEYNEHPWRVLKAEEIQKSYDSLTRIQKNCLLCFAVFPCHKVWDKRYQIWKSLNIKKRILIHWWIGEGLIDRQDKENASATKLNTVEEVGKQMFKVLQEKKFILPEVFIDNWESRSSCCMRASVHSFVTRQALEERFFDFHGQGESHKLTPHLTTGSERACLLKSQENLPSSCKLWANYTNSPEKLECFKTLRTLFNFDETVIDIKVEWFSKMRNLFVLHLENLNFGDGEHIEVTDMRFLEELKSMKQLRLLSLKGFPTMKKLPNSVCKLTNLRILILRDCSYLEELPPGIGSLKQLVHLDLTHCHTLSKLPKGVRLLSKLEVLKGFVISYQIGGWQHRKACTLRELVELENLRKLNLIVNADKFPCSEDLQVFRDMTNLCNLKITWETSYNNDQEQEHEAPSRWQQLKCWEKRPHQNGKEESLRSTHDNLNKLVLCCFPAGSAPNWLHPSEMQKLEKLYIIGGKLKILPGDTDKNTWNVKTLRLRHLPNLDMDWHTLHSIFSKMTSFEMSNLPGDNWENRPRYKGLWYETSENMVWKAFSKRR